MLSSLHRTKLACFLLKGLIFFSNRYTFSHAQRQKLHIEFRRHPQDEIFSIALRVRAIHSVPLCALYLARHTRRSLSSVQWQRSRRRNHFVFHFVSKKSWPKKTLRGVSFVWRRTANSCAPKPFNFTDSVCMR